VGQWNTVHSFIILGFFFYVDDICVPWNTHILLIYTCTMSCPKKTNNSKTNS
jgi:hypothetical protein